METMSRSNKLSVSLLVLLLGLLLSGCGSGGRYSATLITEGDHRISSGELMESGLLLLEGNFTVEQGATIQGSVFVLGGELNVLGAIDGDLSMMQGEVGLGPEARISGDLIQAGGELARTPGSLVQGQTPSSQLDATNIILGESDSRPAVPGMIFRAIVQGLLAAAALRWAPKSVGRVTDAITRQPLASAAVGVFTGLIALLLMVQMAFTVVLVPLSILLGILVLLSVSLSAIFYGNALGNQIAGRTGWRGSPSVVAGLGAALFSLLSDGLQFIPYVGAAVQLLLIAISIGALILTRFGLRPFQPRRTSQLI